MPRVDDFMDEVVADYRRRLVLLGDSGGLQPRGWSLRDVEDGVAFLTEL